MRGPRRTTLIVVATVVATLALARALLGPWGSARHVGGPWYALRETRLIPEAGFAKSTIYRRSGPRLVEVDRSVSALHFYDPDCLVYDGYRTGAEHTVFAACGARIPFAIDRYAGGTLTYTADGVARLRDEYGKPIAQ